MDFNTVLFDLDGTLTDPALGITNSVAYALEKMGITPAEAVMVGDQLFTDILGANRMDIYSILTERIDKKEIFPIKLKRPFEKIVLTFYKK